jgi:hypothetical protein
MTVNAKIEILIPQLSSKFLKCSKLTNPALHSPNVVMTNAYGKTNWFTLIYLLGGSLNIYLRVQ